MVAFQISKTRLKADFSGNSGGENACHSSLKRSEDSLRVLLYVWDISLRLLHPFMPFITEVCACINPAIVYIVVIRFAAVGCMATAATPRGLADAG